MVRRWSGERGRGGDGVNGPSVSVVWCVRVDMTDRLRMVSVLSYLLGFLGVLLECFWMYTK